MPIYKYRCVECEYEFESLQTIKEEPLEDCPKCLKGECLEKCISLTSFRLIGGGWFKDDYNKN